MTRPTIHDGGIEREMTQAEHDQWLQLVANIDAEAAAADAVATAKASAINKLTALGLTEAEIFALLGA